jgi:hypothetical protein
MTEAFDDRVERLIATLDSLVGLLRASDQEFWADWIETAREQIQRRDPSGLDYLLSAYGGMGSLNDLYLGQDTDCFDALKNDAWSSSMELRRELLRP